MSITIVTFEQNDAGPNIRVALNNNFAALVAAIEALTPNVTYSTEDGSLTLTGSGTNYTMNRIPANNTLNLYDNGQRLNRGGDYIISGGVNLIFNRIPVNLSGTCQ